MTSTIPSAALVPAAYESLTCASSQARASSTSCAYSRPAARTSSASARDLEARGQAKATVTRRLCTVAGFYRYAVEAELLGHSPTAHVRRPRLDYESHATGLDRNELGALPVAAGLGPPVERTDFAWNAGIGPW